MSINEKLKVFLVEHRIDQKDIAKIAGVTEGAVSQWLSGTTLPKIGRLQKITEHFGLPVSVLIDENTTTDAVVKDNKTRILYSGDDELKIEIANLTKQILENTDNTDTLVMLRDMLSGVCKK